jgi:hypothetical protein
MTHYACCSMRRWGPLQGARSGYGLIANGLTLCFQQLRTGRFSPALSRYHAATEQRSLSGGILCDVREPDNPTPLRDRDVRRHIGTGNAGLNRSRNAPTACHRFKLRTRHLSRRRIYANRRIPAYPVHNTWVARRRPAAVPPPGSSRSGHYQAAVPLTIWISRCGKGMPIPSSSKRFLMVSVNSNFTPQ